MRTAETAVGLASAAVSLNAEKAEAIVEDYVEGIARGVEGVCNTGRSARQRPRSLRHGRAADLPSRRRTAGASPIWVRSASSPPSARTL